MPLANLTNRLAKLASKISPNIEEIDWIFEAAISDETRTMLLAYRDEDSDPLQRRNALSFWKDPDWRGVKLAIDSYWPRKIWEPVHNEWFANQLGFKNWEEQTAIEFWFVESIDDEQRQAIRAGTFDFPGLDVIRARYYDLPYSIQESYRIRAKNRYKDLYRS